MTGMNRVALVLGLLAFTAVSAEAGELIGPGDGITNEIVVANGYRTEVVVYLEDADGGLGLVGRVHVGDVGRFDVPADVSERGAFRVKVYPVYNPDPWSTADDAGIKTRALHLANGEMLVLWVASDLEESSMEVVAG